MGLTFCKGQPYSIIDFSGAIGSIYYSTADGIEPNRLRVAPQKALKLAPLAHGSRSLVAALTRLLHSSAVVGRAEWCNRVQIHSKLPYRGTAQHSGRHFKSARHIGSSSRRLRRNTV
jgi:hypothetical protein